MTNNSNWQTLFDQEFSKSYYSEIQSVISQQKEDGVIIYPPTNQVFKAYDNTPLKNVKVVILGQDPYHNPGEAMGLSFSVPKDIKIPRSLSNIYKELQTDLALIGPSHGDLTTWSLQGVLLLNAFLTVQQKKPGSHRKIGWQFFTDATIRFISEELDNIVFMLWGNFAKSKSDLINHNKHLVLTAAHPSPLARGAFFGSKHFSKANQYLKTCGKKEIDWSIK